MNAISRRTVLAAPAVLVGAAAVATAPATALERRRPKSAADLLTWAPPPLTNPVTLDLENGNTRVDMDVSTDYILKLPSTVKTGSTQLTGGRNVVMIGGHIRQSNPDGAGNIGAAIRVTGNLGIVHLEGVYIDTTDDGNGDALAIQAKDSIVQVQNCRFAGLKGAQDVLHADVIQPWGGVKELRVDKLTGTSTYQGLFMAVDLGPIGNVIIKRTNLRALPEWYTGGGGGYMLWLKAGEGTHSYGFTDTYVEPRSARTLADSVWPNAEDPTHPLVIENGFGTWPSTDRITGGVHEGPPPGGDYVPIGAAGIGYVSPGYQRGTS